MRQKSGMTYNLDELPQEKKQKQLYVDREVLQILYEICSECTPEKKEELQRSEMETSKRESGSGRDR